MGEMSVSNPALQHNLAMELESVGAPAVQVAAVSQPEQTVQPKSPDSHEATEEAWQAAEGTDDSGKMLVLALLSGLSGGLSVFVCWGIFQHCRCRPRQRSEAPPQLLHNGSPMNSKSRAPCKEEDEARAEMFTISEADLIRARQQLDGAVAVMGRPVTGPDAGGFPGHVVVGYTAPKEPEEDPKSALKGTPREPTKPLATGERSWPAAEGLPAAPIKPAMCHKPSDPGSAMVTIPAELRSIVGISDSVTTVTSDASVTSKSSMSTPIAGKLSLPKTARPRKSKSPTSPESRGTGISDSVTTVTSDASVTSKLSLPKAARPRKSKSPTSPESRGSAVSSQTSGGNRVKASDSQTSSQSKVSRQSSTTPSKKVGRTRASLESME